MTRIEKLPLAFALFLWSSLGLAQSNLGELLDAGAKRMSPDEFKQELVQRVIAGPTPTGQSLELMYTATGLVQGNGQSSTYTFLQLVPVHGNWTIDDSGRICTSMRYALGTSGASGGGPYLPPRCQVWFKLGDKYFISDSDTDRRGRVLVRTLKQ